MVKEYHVYFNAWKPYIF